MKPLLAITLPNHWSIKNMFHAGVIRRLQQHCRIQCWADPARFEGLHALADSLGLESIDWQATPAIEERKHQTLLRHLQKSALLEHHGVKTEQIVMYADRGKRTKAQRAAAKVVRAVATSKAGPATLKALELIRRANSLRFSSLHGEPADLIFTTNPVDYREDPWVHEAHQRKVKVATFVPSWDNLSSKGVLRPDFDCVMTWSQTMQSEVRSMYPGYALRQVPIVGLPRFDVYLEELPPQYQRERFLSALGMDPDRRVLLFANTATRSFRQQPQVIRHLAEMLERPEFRNTQLLIRAHPHDDVSLYRALGQLPRVALWPSPEAAETAFGVNGCPPADDLWVLAAMVRHADVVINAASTIALDASVADRPVVSVAYDGDEELPYRHSIRNAYDYSHQRPFVESGAAPIVKTRRQMEEAVMCALDDPAERREQRQRLALLATQGGSAERMTEVLLGLLGRS